VAVALAAILAVLALLSIGLVVVFPDRVGITAVHGRSFPGPGVTPTQREERLQLEARQRRLLAGGDGRLPIEAAMDRIAARGERAFDPVGDGS
jgi:hypothetical protein